MGLNERLEKALENMEEIKIEMLSKAYGLDVPKPGVHSWWSQNYLIILIYAFLLASAILCYWLGYISAARVIVLLLFISFVRWVFKWVKKAWIWLRTYLKVRKLLKQALGLKRE